MAKSPKPIPALPKGVVIGRTGLICSRELSPKEWEALGPTLMQLHTGVQWALGEWGDQVVRRYGDGKMAAMAKNCGYAPHTLQNYVSIVRKFEPSRRRENLSFSHHDAVAPLGPEKQDQWLDIAEKKGWSAKELRQKISEDGDHCKWTDDKLAEHRIQQLEQAARIPKIIIPLREDDAIKACLLNDPSKLNRVLEAFENAETYWRDAAEFLRDIKSESDRSRIKRVA